MAAAKVSKIKFGSKKFFSKKAKKLKEAKFVYKPVLNEAYINQLEIYIYASNRIT